MGSGTHDVTVTLAARIINMATGLLTQSALARCLGPDDRGSFAASYLFSTVLYTIFLFGLDGAGLYYAASGRLSPAKSVSSTLSLAALGGLLGILAGVLLVFFPPPAMANFFRQADRASFLISLGLIIPMALNICVAQLLAAFKGFLQMALLTFVQSCLQFLAVLALVWWLRLGVHGAMLASISSAAIVGLLGLVYLRRQPGVHWTWPGRDSVVSMLRYGFRYYPGSLSNMADLQIGAVLLAGMITDPKPLGFFTVATILIGRVSILPDVIAAALTPRLAAGADGRPDLAAQAARIVACLTGLTLGLIALLAAPIVTLLFSARFLEVACILQILALGAFIRSAAKVFIPYLNGTNRPGVYSLTIIIGTEVNILLLVFLLPAIGLPGAAWAMAASHAASGLLLIALFHYYSRMPLVQAWCPRKADWDLMRTALGRVTGKFIGALPFVRRRT